MKSHYFGFFALLFGASAGLTFGAGFYIPVQDPFALSRGNAFVGDADSPAAVYYNPAGLTQLDRKELQVGAYAIDIHHQTEVDGDSFDAKREWQAIPQIYYAHPVSDKVTAGLGLNTPFGLGTRWGMDTPFRTHTTNAKLTYGTLWSVVGVEVDPKISLGAGIGVHYVEGVLEQGIGIFPGDEFAFRGDDVSPSFILSLHWRPVERHFFGLTYRSKTDFDLAGTAETKETRGLFPIGDQESAKFDLVTPATLALGYKFQLTDRWELAADVEWVNFDSLNTSTIRTDSLDIPIAFEWEDSIIYGIGASHHFDNGYRFAFGYTFVGNSGPDKTFNPAVDDADRHWINAGFGREMDNWSWFLGYQFAFSDRTVTTNPTNLAGESANGEFDVNAHSISISLSRKF